MFVHGFNTTFEDALYLNAQIDCDLQYSGLSVLFTWASRGSVADYIYDKESAYLARDGFIKLLETLKLEYGIEQVNVLAIAWETSSLLMLLQITHEHRTRFKSRISGWPRRMWTAISSWRRFQYPRRSWVA
ncbi:hypothetical protein MPC4_250070 [Methylocella tundrae]|uniref:Uncharacterized protein n=1 Tax=Methylocella tundrae TaxID=227605 RepID=A0A8B6M8I4_METTU|nr:hypothetical protein MPC1_1620004 [Methylocella tundrae]VTZ50562.1 hypothetical protein MPC4_250070 [Methylocella tundrae]